MVVEYFLWSPALCYIVPMLQMEKLRPRTFKKCREAHIVISDGLNNGPRAVCHQTSLGTRCLYTYLMSDHCLMDE